MANYISSSAQLVGDVVIGDGNFIGDNCRIYGPVTIGNNNHFATGAVIGLVGQDESLSKEVHDRSILGEAPTGAEIMIGDNNIFREFSTIHRGIDGKTSVGSGVYLMTYANISHNSKIHDGVKIASNVQMGGYTTICRGAYIGMSAVIHQFSVIGAYCMVGMGSVVTRNIPTATKAYGNPCREIGPNVIALERLGIVNLDWWGKIEFTEVDKVWNTALSHENTVFEMAVDQRRQERFAINEKRSQNRNLES